MEQLPLPFKMKNQKPNGTPKTKKIIKLEGFKSLSDLLEYVEKKAGGIQAARIYKAPKSGPFKGRLNRKNKATKR